MFVKDILLFMFLIEDILTFPSVTICIKIDVICFQDIKSIVKQLNFCYASNRRAADPLQVCENHTS
jgi:hypothetical protein